MKFILGVRATLILLVLISIAPIFVVVVQTSRSEQEAALEKARINLRTQVKLRANSQQQLFEGARHMLTAVAHAVPARSGGMAACSEYLRDLKEHFPAYGNLGFADPAGNVLCRSAEPRPLYIGDRTYFNGALRSGRFTVGGYLVSRTSHRPSLIFSLPVQRPEGGLIGVLYAVLDLATIQKEFGALSVPPDMSDAVADSQGIVLAAAGEHAPGMGRRLDGFLLQAVQRRESEVHEALDSQGEQWLYAVNFVAPEGAGELVVLSLMPSRSVFEPAVQRLQRQLLLLLAIALAASLLAWWLGDRLLARPVQRLLDKVKSLEQGQFVPVSAPTPGPVRELALIDRGIDDLAASLAARSAERRMAVAALQQQARSLELSEQRYRAQFEASPQPMWVFDASTLAFLVVNDAAVAHYGYSREEFMGMTLAQIRPPEDIPLLLETIERTGPEPRNLDQRRHRCRNGDIIHVEIATHAVVWEGRQARATIVYDVTSRELARQAWQRLQETLEQQVAQRTRDLALANDELEAFSYSVSHDLRGPLHIIDGFCDALVRKHGDQLPPQASHYLARIRAGTEQMNALISDLLSFARTGRAALDCRQVDLAPLAARVVAALRLGAPERHVSVDIEPSLPAFCDPTLLTVVLENLVGNAWKFTSRAPQASIRIAAAGATAGDRTYVVRDNGAGFDMAYAGKLFKAFQRLHSAGEFEGTGIGLAIVARVIHRHGGRVWAESEPGHGASFYFSLANDPGAAQPAALAA